MTVPTIQYVYPAIKEKKKKNKTDQKAEKYNLKRLKRDLLSDRESKTPMING